uniref:Uncharacterized protein n=1 Tax=viral metagenome TaxID=1070528 RepID=A0A6C0AQ51_9ZZZZ
MSDRYIPIPLRQQQQQQLLPPKAPVHRTNSLPPRPKLLNIKSETDFPSLVNRNTIHNSINLTKQLDEIINRNPIHNPIDLTKQLANMTISKKEEEEWRPTTPEFGKFDCITEEDKKSISKPSENDVWHD